ncbi:MAG: DUF805 domain-containing protein [Oscillospiraceae bacterium]|nr:DUF805 domain-containing protein [Oscillospiraceae bacterium]MBR6717677.1 DUF805 domain-containing protein [Oscillospiraceae bacterium]
MDKILNIPFVQAYLKMLANFSDFKGRTDRKSFWLAVLCQIIISAILGFVLGLLGKFGAILLWIISLVLCVPMLAMAVRRLHDTNRSGLWLLLSLTAIGNIVLIVFWALEGNPDSNQYGPNPKYMG